MKTIKELNEAMQAIVDLAEAETRSLSDEEVTTYEGLETELHSAQKSEDIGKRQAARNVIVGFPSVIHAAPKGDQALEFAFSQYLRTGQANQDIAQLYSQNEGSTTAGGYLVPALFRQKLTERMVAFGGLRNAAETLSTGNGNPIEWPTVDDTSATRADIVAEGAASAAGADITFGIKTLGAYRYAATGTGNVPIKVSVELLQDSAFDVAAFVARALGTRIARKQAVDLMQGSGSGAPLGLLTGTHTGNIALAGGDVITYAKLVDLVHAIDPAYRPAASWIFNDATAAELEKLVDGSSRPLMLPAIAGGIANSVSSSTLLGYPVIIDQAAFNKSNQVNFAAFGDLREAYIVREVKDVQVLVNPYAATGYVVYDAWARMDGTIQNANAVVKLEGTT